MKRSAWDQRENTRCPLRLFRRKRFGEVMGQHVFWLTVSNLLPAFPFGAALHCIRRWLMGFVTDYSGATASDLHGLPFVGRSITLVTKN